ncbi:MAG: hypothetical protein QF471_05835 [Phycisphaerales bacterium]|nr:hypothetical protein [Phycisphaerales bacterium]
MPHHPEAIPDPIMQQGGDLHSWQTTARAGRGDTQIRSDTEVAEHAEQVADVHGAAGIEVIERVGAVPHGDHFEHVDDLLMLIIHWG